MLRRTFLAACAIALTPLSAAADMIDYTPGAINAALADGQTVFVDYSATWCGTCARQERVISKLRAENPAYDDAMTFIRVNWDDFKNADVTTSREIPRRSTLLVLRGNEELGRNVAGTSVSAIRDLMDLGLQDAS
ncbi:MAG: thioredoxin family protein [Pseudomonadota bacterium]